MSLNTSTDIVHFLPVVTKVHTRTMKEVKTLEEFNELKKAHSMIVYAMSSTSVLLLPVFQDASA